jgi:hypothetical protein
VADLRRKRVFFGEKNFCRDSARGFRFGSFGARIGGFTRCHALADSAALAQLVEQFIRNEEVDSSIPSSGTTSPQMSRSKSRS